MNLILSVQEDLGITDSDYSKPKYKIVGKVSRRVRRSVTVLNQYDTVFGFGFPTHEDGPVRGSRRLIWWAIYLICLVACVFTLPTRDIGLLALTSAALTLIITMVGGNLAMHQETLVDWLASRIFGTPCRPRHYIAQAMKRGQVEEIIPS